MTNEEKAMKYENRRKLATSICTGALVGDVAFGVWDAMNSGFDCKLPVVFFGAVFTVAAIGFAISKENPYKETVKEDNTKEQENVKQMKKSK